MLCLFITLFVHFKMLDTTCNFGLLQVNVGCVPKKIMFNTAVHAEMIKDHKDYGFDVEVKQFTWGYDTCTKVICLFHVQI